MSSTTLLAAIAISSLAVVIPFCASERPSCPCPCAKTKIEAPEQVPSDAKIVEVVPMMNSSISRMYEVVYEDGSRRRIVVPPGQPQPVTQR